MCTLDGNFTVQKEDEVVGNETVLDLSKSQAGACVAILSSYETARDGAEKLNQFDISTRRTPVI